MIRVHHKVTFPAAGPSALAALLVMGLLVVINSYLLWHTKKIKVKVMAFADKRIKAISEIISGIKVGRGKNGAQPCRYGNYKQRGRW